MKKLTDQQIINLYNKNMLLVNYHALTKETKLSWATIRSFFAGANMQTRSVIKIEKVMNEK